MTEGEWYHYFHRAPKNDDGREHPTFRLAKTTVRSKRCNLHRCFVMVADTAAGLFKAAVTSTPSARCDCLPSEPPGETSWIWVEKQRKNDDGPDAKQIETTTWLRTWAGTWDVYVKVCVNTQSTAIQAGRDKHSANAKMQAGCNTTKLKEQGFIYMCRFCFWGPESVLESGARRWRWRWGSRRHAFVAIQKNNGAVTYRKQQQIQ